MSPPVICQKCSAVRPPDSSAPQWQCPACGVAYAKVGERAQLSGVVRGKLNSRSDGATPSLFHSKWALLALLLVLVGVGSHLLRGRVPAASGAPSNIDVRLGANPSLAELAALAAKMQPQDIVLYGTSWCPNCAAAKQWMGSYGFRYQECDVEKSPACAAEFRNLGADGVPYLVVKGHHMKDGFDSDEFVAAVVL